MNDERQSAYYQTIAREFLRRRGAPFFLSPRDLSLISAWEERAVPLHVVLEGIERAFDGLRDRSRGTRGLGLACCERQVERALAQQKDRSAGRRKRAAPRSAKQVHVREEVGRFLQSLRPDDEEVASRFKEALEVLSRTSPDEEALERIDQDIDGILSGRAKAGEWHAVKREVLKDFPGQDPGEIDSLARTKLVKSLRDKQKVPYVSLFYY